MTSSHHGPYVQGYTRDTMVDTMGEAAMVEEIPKVDLSSDCSLQLDYMKLESLVIVDQLATVNTFPGLVHTARQAMGSWGRPKPAAMPFKANLVTGAKS